MTPQEYIDAHFEEYLEEIMKIARIPSISPIPGYEQNIRDCAEAVRSLMEKCGISAYVCPSPIGKGSPIVYGKTPYVEGAPGYIIYGHYDVQPEGDHRLWESDPFEPTRRNGRIYARGIGDNKGQILSHVIGYDACRKTIGLPHLNLTYLIEGEEESGSHVLKEFILSHKDDLLSGNIATMFSDTSMNSFGDPLIVLAIKGITAVHLTVKGPDVPVHSMWSSEMESPVWALTRVLDGMKDADGHVRIKGFYDDTIGPDEHELALIDELPDERKYWADTWHDPAFKADSRTKREFYERYMFETTMNIGCIYAGNPDGSKNIVPDQAEAWIDIRLARGAQPEHMIRVVQNYLDSCHVPGLTAEFTGIPAGYSPLDHPCIPPVKEALEEAFGRKAFIYSGQGGSGPFYLFNDVLKAPVIQFPFADSQQHDHGYNESVPEDILRKGMKTVSILIGKLSR